MVKTDDGCEYVVEVTRSHRGFASINERFSKARKLKAFVVFDPSKASDDIDRIMSMVSETELRLENTRRRDPESVYRKLPPSVRRYPGYTVDSEGCMHIERK